jgi:glycosyltransferase involved in cell wall biosynthesis
LAGVTGSRRRARTQKYREADPAHEFQDDYAGLLTPPGPVHPWVPRPADLPFFSDPAGSADLGTHESFDADAPVLSAIVIARDDADRIERVVRSVVTQETPEPFETIVVVSGSPRTADVVRRRFPDVTLVELPDPVFPGAAREAGLALARGDFVSFPGSHIELPQGSLAARVRAHERGYAMVTGSTLNATRTPAGWAAYFLDHSSALPGRPSGELAGPPVHCSYEREILSKVQRFPEGVRAGEDTVVNHALAQLGYRAFRAADVTIVHANPCRNARALVRHHFSRGRGFGRILIDATPEGESVIRLDVVSRHLFGYLPRRIGSTTANVEAWGGPELRTVYRRVKPLVCLGAVSAWLGTWFELLRGPRPGRGAPAR